MAMPAAILAQWVTPHRALLIKYFSREFAGTSKAAAEQLTDIAITAGYIGQRLPVPGENLKQWVLQGNAPFWACRSAFDYLVNHGWIPHDDVERALYARFALANTVFVSAETQALLGQFWPLACAAQKESIDDDEYPEL